MFAFIVWLVVTLVTELMKPDTRTAGKKYSLNEIDVPTATEDRAVPWGVGTWQVAGNVLAKFDYKSVERTKSVRTGWFSTATQPIGNEYYVGMWISLSAAICDSVKEVRVGEHLVWSGDQALSTTTTTALDVNKTWAESEGELVQDGFRGRFVFYNHKASVDDLTSTYVPLETAYLDAKVGEPVPAYPNTCHCVFLGPSGGTDIGLVGKPLSRPQYGFIGTKPSLGALLITLKRLPDLYSALGRSARDFRYLTYPFVGTVNGGDYTRAELDAWLAARADIHGDANPAFVMLELLTTPVPGIGPRMGTYALNLESFFRAADTLKNEENGVSFAWESSKSLRDVLDGLSKQIQGQLEINERTGQLQLTLMRSTDVPVMRFDDSNIIELTSFSRVAVEDAVNEVQVPFVDREYAWQERIESAFNSAGVRSAGTSIATSREYIGVSRQALAQQLASRDIRAAAAPLADASWSGTVEPGTILRPSQLVEFVHSPTGQLLRMRLKTVRFANWDSKLRVEIEAVEDVFRNGVAGVSTPPIAPAPGTVGPPESLTGGTFAPAPYALHGDDYDHLMYVGMDPGLTTATFQTGVQEGRTAWSDFDTAEYTNGHKEPAITGFLVSALSAASVSPTLQLTLSDAAVQQWKKSTRTTVYLVIGTEWLACSAWTLTGNTLTATSAERGIFDTVPGRYAVGTAVKVLLGCGLYEARAKTYVTAGVELSGITSAVARAEAVGPGGVLDVVDADASEASWTYASVASSARAPKPLPPANVRIGSIVGALKTTDAVPNLTRAPSVTMNWNNRNRLTRGAAGYYTATNDNEPTVTLSYSLDWETAPGVFSNSGTYTTMSAGVTTASVNLSSVPAGARMIRLRVITNRPIPVTGGTNFCQSNALDLFWQLAT